MAPVPAKKTPKAAVLPSFDGLPFTGTMLDAMDLAGMTGPTWDPWRTFWKAVFALPMHSGDLERYKRHTGRESPPAKPVQEAWQPIGRRGGKSRNDAIAAGYLAIRRDYRPLLAPGERAVIPVIAADRKQARQIMNYLKGFVALPGISQYLAREPLTASVEFTTGVTVEIATASYRTTRGYTVVALIAEEIAFWRSEDSAEPDAEVLNAIRPGMATIPDALLLVPSTPYARKGELYRTVQDYYGKADPYILIWNADTLSMHHTDRLARIVEKAFGDDPVAAASEYGQDGHVTFRSDVEAYLTEEAVTAAIVAGRLELPPVAGMRYFAFVDPSGGSQDAYTLAIAHRVGDGDNLRLSLDLLRESPPPFSPEAVTADYAAVLHRYGCTEVRGDRYAGEFPREPFRRHGITYRVADDTKSDLYRNLLPAVNAGRVELLDHKRLKSQLCGLERFVARSGQDTIDHAPGGHDDVANAAAGALVTAGTIRQAVSLHIPL